MNQCYRFHEEICLGQKAYQRFLLKFEIKELGVDVNFSFWFFDWYFIKIILFLRVRCWQNLFHETFLIFDTVLAYRILILVYEFFECCSFFYIICAYDDGSKLLFWTNKIWMYKWKNHDEWNINRISYRLEIFKH